jgi:hypothetical protein
MSKRPNGPPLVFCWFSGKLMPTKSMSASTGAPEQESTTCPEIRISSSSIFWMAGNSAAASESAVA